MRQDRGNRHPRSRSSEQRRAFGALQVVLGLGDGSAFRWFLGEVHPTGDVGLILRLAFDQDGFEAFSEGGFTRGARSGKAVKNRAARRGDEAHEVLNEVQRLDRRVLAPETVFGIGLAV